MVTWAMTWEEEIKVKAAEERGKVPAGVVTEAVKPEAKLEPLTVRVVAMVEVTEEGEMEVMVGVGVGVGVGLTGPPAGSAIRLLEIIRSSYHV